MQVLKITLNIFVGLIILNLYLWIPVLANQKPINIDSPIFHKLTNKDGLSQGTINAIAQDKMGFIWIGTNDGLNRYDGYDVKTFRNTPGHTSSISSNEINSILCDENGKIWIGTSQGLNYFDTKKVCLVSVTLPGTAIVMPLQQSNRTHKITFGWVLTVQVFFISILLTIQ